jgi:hypothetical protein
MLIYLEEPVDEIDRLTEMQRRFNYRGNRLHEGAGSDRLCQGCQDAERSQINCKMGQII